MASCLDSPVRGIRLWHPKQIFFEEKDDAAPQSPTLACAQNLFVERTSVN